MDAVSGSGHVTGYDCCPPNPLERIEEGSIAPRHQAAAVVEDLSRVDLLGPTRRARVSRRRVGR
jgi:hypothetical protein